MAISQKPGKPLTPYEKTFDYDKDGKLDNFEKADMWDDMAKSAGKGKKPAEKKESGRPDQKKK